MVWPRHTADPLSSPQFARATGALTLGQRIIGILILFTLNFARPGLAENRAPDAVKPSAIPVGNLSLTDPVSGFRQEEDFYRKYCAPIDDKIEIAYLDRWSYHESQLPYLAASWNHQHLSNSSINDVIAPQYDGAVRNQFAQQVLRMRADSILKTYLASTGRGESIKHAQQAIAKAKNYEVSLSGDAHPAKLEMGYDLYTDGFKVEYVSELFRVRLSQPHLLGTMGNAEGTLDGLSLQVSTDLGINLPTAYVRCPLSGTFVEMGLLKSLSPVLSTSLITLQPLRGTAFYTPTYSLGLTYHF
jgi:hypothetical protein